MDRKKDMIKTGGENVASRGVEEALYRLPGVSEVALVGLPHPRWIEAVTAIVVCKPGQVLTETQVIEHCAGQLARFKTPKAVLFTDSLPKSPSDKLLKRELRLRFERHFTCRQRVVIGLCRKSRRRNLIRTYASRPLSPPTYRGSTIKHRGVMDSRTSRCHPINSACCTWT